MSWQRLIKGLAIALALLLGCIPLAFGLMLVLLPALRWGEATYAIELIGHSGPAEWVLWVIYAAVVSVAAMLWAYASWPSKGRPD